MPKRTPYQEGVLAGIHLAVDFLDSLAIQTRDPNLQEKLRDIGHNRVRHGESLYLMEQDLLSGKITWPEIQTSLVVPKEKSQDAS